MGATTAAIAALLGRRAGRTEKRQAGVVSSANNAIALWMKEDSEICCSGYTRLCDNPEIQTACLRQSGDPDGMPADR